VARLIKVADWSGPKRGSVVFVHGLGGHPFDTWRRYKFSWRRRRRELVENSMWPAWLADDLKGVAVYTLGYSSPLTNWIGTAMPILDESENIFRQLLTERDLRHGPITFVCHSMGGLIVKHILRSAKEGRARPEIADFYIRTKQVVFIATPHTGSGHATLLERFRYLTWPSGSTKNLVANSPDLRNLNTGYRLLAEERRADLQHLAYFEMVPTIFSMIVKPDSADPGLTGVRAVAVRDNHIRMAKLADKETLIYREVRDLVAQLADEPAAPGEKQTYELSRFAEDWSWSQQIPKVLRLATLVLLVAAGFYLFPAVRQLVTDVGTTKNVVQQSADELKTASHDIKTIRDDVKILLRQRSQGDDNQSTLRLVAVNIDDGVAAGDPQYLKALQALQRGDIAAAVQLLSEIAGSKDDKRAKAAAYRDAGAVAGLSQPHQAIELYAQALKFEPDDRESLYWIGWLNQLAGDWTKAESALNELLKLSLKAGDQRGLYRARLRLGELELDRGNLEFARRNIESALAIAAAEVRINKADLTRQRDLAIAHVKFGGLLRYVGELDRALLSYNEALAIEENILKLTPDNKLFAEHDLAVTQRAIGNLQRDKGNLTAALAIVTASFETFRRHAQSSPQNANWQRDWATAHGDLAWVYHSLGNRKAVLENHQQALFLRTRLSALYPENANWQRDLAVAHQNAGNEFWRLGERMKALSTLQSGLSILERISKGLPENGSWQQDMATALRNIGNKLVDLKNFSEARVKLAAAHEINASLVKKYPANIAWQSSLAYSYSGIAWAYKVEKDFAKALENYHAALAIRERLATTYAENPLIQGHLASLHLDLGLTLQDAAISSSSSADKLAALQRLTAASASFQTALRIRKQLAQAFPDNPSRQQDLASAYRDIGFLLEIPMRRPEDAVEYYREAFVLWNGLSKSNPENVQWSGHLARAYADLGDVLNKTDAVAAKKNYQSAIRILEQLLESHPNHESNDWARELNRVRYEIKQL
jgi:tetratricopeptide (TPR) repeat protein/pimeloyl-ACP methyl ester carboxylesterase